MQNSKQDKINTSTAINFIDEDSGLVVTTRVDVFNDTIWLTQNEIAKHLNNIIKEGELDENSVCAFFAHTGPDGDTEIMFPKTILANRSIYYKNVNQMREMVNIH